MAAISIAVETMPTSTMETATPTNIGASTILDNSSAEKLDIAASLNHETTNQIQKRLNYIFISDKNQIAVITAI
jgi:hypothetical protein